MKQPRHRKQQGPPYELCKGCGRSLTDDKSRRLGFGPECRKTYAVIPDGLPKIYDLPETRYERRQRLPIHVFCQDCGRQTQVPRYDWSLRGPKFCKQCNGLLGRKRPGSQVARKSPARRGRVLRAFCTNEECHRSHRVPEREWLSGGENRCACGGLLQLLKRQS